MEIIVEVEIHSAYGRGHVEVILTENDIRSLAENKVIAGYTVARCKAMGIKLIMNEAR